MRKDVTYMGTQLLMLRTVHPSYNVFSLSIIRGIFLAVLGRPQRLAKRVLGLAAPEVERSGRSNSLIDVVISVFRQSRAPHSPPGYARWYPGHPT